MMSGDGFFSESELGALGLAQVGSNVKISRLASIVGFEFIRVGNNVRVDDFVSIVCSSSGFLNIENYVHIAGGSYLGCSGGVTFESFSGVSQGVRIYSASDDYSGDFLTNPTTPIELRNVTHAPQFLKQASLLVP
jgi:galactoside O-acetyltransferase